MEHLTDLLGNLKESLVEMNYLVMKQINKSVAALKNYDKILAEEVNRNEKRVNAIELKIDKDCERIIALQAPVAKDLRFVFATFKINSNLERIGDYAESLAKVVIDAEKPFPAELLEALRFDEPKGNVGSSPEILLRTVFLERGKGMEQYRTEGGRSYGNCGEKRLAERSLWELLYGVLCFQKVVDDCQRRYVPCIQSNTERRAGCQGESEVSK